MIVTYRHNTYEMDGSWNSDTSELAMQFIHKKPGSNWEARQESLATALGLEILGPSIELIELDEVGSIYDIVAVNGLFVTLSGNALLSQFMENVNIAAMSALRMPPPSPENIMDYVASQTLKCTAKKIQEVCRSDLITRQRSS
jgi:hypothetical protein